MPAMDELVTYNPQVELSGEIEAFHDAPGGPPPPPPNSGLTQQYERTLHGFPVPASSSLPAHNTSMSSADRVIRSHPTHITQSSKTNQRPPRYTPRPPPHATIENKPTPPPASLHTQTPT